MGNIPLWQIIPEQHSFRSTPKAEKQCTAPKLKLQFQNKRFPLLREKTTRSFLGRMKERQHELSTTTASASSSSHSNAEDRERSYALAKREAEHPISEHPIFDRMCALNGKAVSEMDEEHRLAERVVADINVYNNDDDDNVDHEHDSDDDDDTDASPSYATSMNNIIRSMNMILETMEDTSSSSSLSSSCSADSPSRHSHHEEQILEEHHPIFDRMGVLRSDPEHLISNQMGVSQVRDTEEIFSARPLSSYSAGPILPIDEDDGEQQQQQAQQEQQEEQQQQERRNSLARQCPLLQSLPPPPPPPQPQQQAIATQRWYSSSSSSSSRPLLERSPFRIIKTRDVIEERIVHEWFIIIFRYIHTGLGDLSETENTSSSVLSKTDAGAFYARLAIVACDETSETNHPSVLFRNDDFLFRHQDTACLSQLFCDQQYNARQRPLLMTHFTSNKSIFSPPSPQEQQPQQQEEARGIAIVNVQVLFDTEPMSMPSFVFMNTLPYVSPLSVIDAENNNYHGQELGAVQTRENQYTVRILDVLGQLVCDLDFEEATYETVIGALREHYPTNIHGQNVISVSSNTIIDNIYCRNQHEWDWVKHVCLKEQLCQNNILCVTVPINPAGSSV